MSGSTVDRPTRDLDLGLSLALLNEERYAAISEALRREGFGTGRPDPARQADAWGYVQELLRLIQSG